MPVQSNSRLNMQFSLADTARIFAQAVSAAHEWRRRLALRKVLGGATDRQLSDAGLIRQDVEDACDLPLTRSAETSVRTAARVRGANW